MSGADCSLTRKDFAVMALLALLGLCIRLYFLQFYDVISADGISYVTIAKEFITGHGLGSASHYPPFYPILLGLASTVTHDFEQAGLAVSIVMGSLLVVPVYLLGAEFFDRRVGGVAAFLSVTWPSLRFWSTSVMSQATYITLLLLGVYFLWRAYRNGGIIPSVVAGVCFGCAHLTRSEGVLVLCAELALLVLLCFVEKRSPRALLYPALCLALFLLVFSPYLVLLHDLTGKWQLTGKSKIAIADALSEYLGRPDLKHDPNFQELGYLDLFRQYPEYIRSNYLKNLKQLWNELLPVYGWILAALGLAAGAATRERRAGRLYLLGTFAPLVIIVVFFFIGPEYTQEYLPVLFLCAAHGLFVLQKRVGELLGPARDGFLSRYGWGIPVVIGVLYGSWMVVQAVPADRNEPYSYEKDGGRLDDKRIGLKLGKKLPESAVLMTRSGRIGFYSGRRYVTPPQTDFAGIVEAARKNRVTYLVATVQLLNVRPQLEFLYDPIISPWKSFTPPPELELVAVDQLPGGLPYILYRFKI